MATPTTRDPPAASAPRSGQQTPAQAQRQAYRRRKARAKARSEARRQEEAGRVEALPVQHPHAAGIDIGSRSHWVCVGFTTDAASCLVREFPAHTDGLQAIAAFLREHQVSTIALESTGVYWIPLYELLQAEGFEVFLVDPSYSRQLRGRPKTDRRDCQWIDRLHSVGLLAAAFRPDEQTCRLRAYLRQRANLVRAASRHVQHMQKALEQMNLKLTEVLSDVTGLTGRAIIRAILRGTRAPEKLATFRDKQCKASEAEIAQALTGSYREEHLFELRLAHEAWQFTLRQVEQVDGQIALQLGRMTGDRALPPLKPKPRPKRRVNSPRFDVRAALYYVVGLDLTEIEGISEPLDLRDHVGQRERLQVQAQRLQHTAHDRLPSGPACRLTGAARLACLGRITQRAFRFVVRRANRLPFAVGLLHGLGRHEREQLTGQQQPQDLVDQPTIIVLGTLQRGQFHAPPGTA